jgi:hypothetical protein
MAKSRRLRIQSVNRVFFLTLTINLGGSKGVLGRWKDLLDRATRPLQGACLHSDVARRAQLSLF